MGNISSSNQSTVRQNTTRLQETGTNRAADLSLFKSLSCGKGSHMIRNRLLDVWQTRPIIEVRCKGTGGCYVRSDAKCQWCKAAGNLVFTITAGDPLQVSYGFDEFLVTHDGCPLFVAKPMLTVLLHQKLCLAEVDCIRDTLDRAARYRIIRQVYLLSLPHDLQSYIAQFVFNVQRGFMWHLTVEDEDCAAR